MSEDWDFYQLLVDSEPASIYLDLGLAGTAPVNSQPHMSYVRVFMRQPREDGLSSQEEFETLVELEEALTEAVSRNGATTFAGRNTSSGNRDFYFYTADPAAFGESAESAMTGYPDYRFEIGTRLDPEWKVYFDFLHPSADDLERISNRRVLESLAADGDDPSKPRMIDHVACLPDAGAAERMQRYLIELGFLVEAPRIEDGGLELAFQRIDQPESIDDVVLPIARRVRELGGDYDGWGCVAVE